MYLISDNVDTLTGMRLAGVDGVVVHERQELKNAIETAMNDKSVGIILLTEKFGREFPDLINEIKLERTMPLLIEIPDRHGTGRKKDFITSYVNEAIGTRSRVIGKEGDTLTTEEKMFHLQTAAMEKQEQRAMRSYGRHEEALNGVFEQHCQEAKRQAETRIKAEKVNARQQLNMASSKAQLELKREIGRTQWSSRKSCLRK